MDTFDLRFNNYQIPAMEDKSKQALLNDNLVYLDENISATIIYRNFKAPGRSYGYKQVNTMASIGFSKNFFIAETDARWKISLPINYEKFKFLNFSNENGVLTIKYNPGVFNEVESGEMEFKFRVKNVNAFNQFFIKK